MPLCISLDTSLDFFFEKVILLGLHCVENFLNGHFLPSNHPLIIPEEAFIANKELHDKDYTIKANRIYSCEICQMEIQGEKCWNTHLKGQKHRKIKCSKKKKEKLKVFGNPSISLNESA